MSALLKSLANKMLDKTTQQKPNTTPILFVNWSDEDFTGAWDGNPTVIPAGSTLWLPFWLAVHFAKHLTDRELNKKGIATDHFSRESYVAKCIGNKPEAKSNDDPLGIKILNATQNAAPVTPVVTPITDNPATTPKKQMGRPKKVKAEEGFEGK